MAAQRIPTDTAISEAIDSYFGFFQRKCHEAIQIHDRIFRRIVLVALISALATGRYASISNDSEKFIKLVEQFGDWPDARRVSVVQLKLLVDRHRKRQKHAGGFTEPFLTALATSHSVAEDALAESRVRRATADPFPQEIFSFALTGDESAAVRRSTHGYLLYQYRSTLVHEAREPGGGFELNENDKVPYYMPTTHADGTHAAELTYPLGLLVHVIESVIARLPQWYREKAINPYDRHRFGSPWVR